MFSQDENFDKLLNEVNELYELGLKFDSYEKRDSIYSKLDSTIQYLFKHKKICSFSFDSTKIMKNNSNKKNLKGKKLAYSFMNKINVTSSEDDKIRIFSWNNLGGGSFHTYSNYIQFQKKDQSCQVIPIDTAQNSTEVGYYKIIDFSCNDRMVYLFMGYGTYGGGKHHYSIRFFEINDDWLKEIYEFYPNKKDLVIYSNRSQDSDIKFDKNSIELSYKKFNYDKDTGFYKDEFKKVAFTIDLCKNGKR